MNQEADNTDVMPVTISIDSDLKHQNIEDLVTQFDDIGNQSQILQGLILLEINARCFQERLSFSEFVQREQIKNSSLCDITHQHRTRLINLAKFFTKDRPMNGISITAGYEISAPKNEKVAVAVYNQAVNQNYSVLDIQKMIKHEMTKLNTKSVSSVKLEYVREIVLSDNAKTVWKTVQGFNISDNEQLFVLKSCCKKMEDKIKLENKAQAHSSN